MFCALCGRRMFGKTLRERRYYVCLGGAGSGSRAAGEHGEYPRHIFARESDLLDGVWRLFREQVFSEQRLSQPLGAEIADIGRARQEVLSHQLANLRRRQERLIAVLELRDDPDGLIFAQVRARLADMERDRALLSDELSIEDPAGLARVPAGSLGEVSVSPVDLARLPAELLCDLFGAFQLEIHYSRPTKTATYRMTVAK